jgi:hypothetical protein
MPTITGSARKRCDRPPCARRAGFLLASFEEIHMYQRELVFELQGAFTVKWERRRLADGQDAR